jgi:predicted enzyme related to lactoylglutathione lyase
VAEDRDPRHGSIVHVEVPAPDLDEASDFYARIFGWQTVAGHESGYRFFRSGSLGGGFDRDMKPSEEGCVVVVAVDDIEETLRQVEEAGGKTVKTKTAIGGEMGYYAYFRDPAGNRLGIWSRT